MENREDRLRKTVHCSLYVETYLTIKKSVPAKGNTGRSESINETVVVHISCISLKSSNVCISTTCWNNGPSGQEQQISSVTAGIAFLELKRHDV